MSNEYETATVAMVAALRDLLKQDDQAPNFFQFTVTAEGRVRDGEVKIMFGVGGNSYTTVVEGDNVQAVIVEYLRRIGWQKSHNYLALPTVKAAEMADA